MSATPDLAQDIINHFFRQSAVTAPSAAYLALFTTQPNQDGTGGVEVAGGSYARQLITLSAPDATGTSSNSADIDFAGMPAAVIVAGGVYTAVSGGTLLSQARFSVSRSVVVGNTFTVPVGDCVVRVRF